jgi:hypothetical protein
MVTTNAADTLGTMHMAHCIYNTACCLATASYCTLAAHGTCRHRWCACAAVQSHWAMPLLAVLRHSMLQRLYIKVPLTSAATACLDCRKVPAMYSASPVHSLLG